MECLPYCRRADLCLSFSLLAGKREVLNKYLVDYKEIYGL